MLIYTNFKTIYAFNFHILPFNVCQIPATAAEKDNIITFPFIFKIVLLSYRIASYRKLGFTYFTFTGLACMEHSPVISVNLPGINLQ